VGVKGDCGVRAGDRDDSPGVSGLAHSAVGSSPTHHPSFLGQAHYNRGRPHMGLGPGTPDPTITPIARPTSRYRRGEPYVARVDPILGGLHHEYTLAAA
jgi:hypothetical protein